MVSAEVAILILQLHILFLIDRLITNQQVIS